MNKGVDFDSFSAKSDDGYLAIRDERQYGKRVVDMNDGFESGARSRVSSSSNRVQRRNVFAGRDENYNADKWDVEVDSFQEKMSRGLARVKIDREFDDSPIYSEDEYSRGLEILGDGRSSFQSMEHEVIRYKREIHDHSSLGNQRYIDGPSNAGDDDREQLLRQIDELKNQLSRSGGLVEKDNEKFPLDRRMPYQDPRGSQNRHPESRLEMNRLPMQFANEDLQYIRQSYDTYQNQYVEPHYMMRREERNGRDSEYIRQSYQYQYAEPHYLMQREETSGNAFIPSRYAPGRIHGYDDPKRSHLSRGAPYQSSPTYHQPESHAYISAGYVNEMMVRSDSMDTYPISRNSNRKVPPIAYSDKYSDIPTEKVLDFHDSPSSFGSQDRNRRIPNPPSLRSSNTSSHKRGSSEVKSETGQLPQRVQLGYSGKLCRSIAGGAPFLACYNCFELLQLPKKVRIKNSARKKVRCGACSAVIAFAVSNKNLVVYGDLVEDNDERHVPSAQGSGFLKQGSIDGASNDFDNSGCDFQCMDGEQDNNKFSEMENSNSPSKHNPEIDAVESLVAAIPDPYPSDMEEKAKEKEKVPPPLAGSTLQDYFDYSNQFHRAKPSGDDLKKGGGISDHSKEILNKTTNRRKESAATEIDYSSNAYSHTRSSFGSSVDGDYQRSGSSRATGSYLAGVDEKSPSGSDRYIEEKDEANVTVNGHLIPNELIMRAENVAGRIRPGNYWYDSRAGFWGVIGGPCLGIIPPMIEEFNYPMPKHCAAGNTKVYVNGRELNQKDLNLLSSRGLPVEKDRSYIVEISGKVLSDDTGFELQSLGKLAPSVEKAKRGFGMRPPKGSLA